MSPPLGPPCPHTPTPASVTVRSMTSHFFDFCNFASLAAVPHAGLSEAPKATSMSESKQQRSRRQKRPSGIWLLP